MPRRRRRWTRGCAGAGASCGTGCRWRGSARSRGLAGSLFISIISLWRV
jgi:hypothetical protein